MSSNQQPSGIFYTNDDDVGFEPCRQDQRRLQQQQAHHCLQQMQCSNESIDIGNEACHNTTTTRRLSNHPSYQHSQQQRYHLRPDQQRQSLVRRDKRNDSPATPLNLPQSNSGMEQQQAVEPQPSVSFNPISEDNSHSFLDDLMWWCSNDTTNGSFSEGTHHNASTNNVSVSRYMNESSPPPPPARAAAAVPNTVASNGIITPNPCSLKTPTSSILSSYRQYLSSFTNSNRDSKPTSNNSTNNKGSFVHSNNRTKTSFHTYMLPIPIEGRLQQDVYIAPTWAAWISQQAQSCGCQFANPLGSHSSTEWSYEAPGNDEDFSPMDVFPEGEKEDNMDDQVSMATDAVSHHSRDEQLYTPVGEGSVLGGGTTVPMSNSPFASEQDYRDPAAFMTPSRGTSQLQHRPTVFMTLSDENNQTHHRQTAAEAPSHEIDRTQNRPTAAVTPSHVNNQGQHCPASFMTPDHVHNQVQHRLPAVTPHSGERNQGHTYEHRRLSPSQFERRLWIHDPSQKGHTHDQMSQTPANAFVFSGVMQTHVGNSKTMDPPAQTNPGRTGSGPSESFTYQWNKPDHHCTHVSNHHTTDGNHIQNESLRDQGSFRISRHAHSSDNTDWDGEIAASMAFREAFPDAETNNRRDTPDVELTLGMRKSHPFSINERSFKATLPDDPHSARVVTRPNSRELNQYPSTNDPDPPSSIQDRKRLSYPTLTDMDSKPPAIHPPNSRRSKGGQRGERAGGKSPNESKANVPSAAGMPRGGPSRAFLNFLRATGSKLKLPPSGLSPSVEELQPCHGKICLWCEDRKACNEKISFVPPPPGVVVVGSSTAIHGSARPERQKSRLQTPRIKRSTGSEAKKRIRKPEVPKEERVYLVPGENDVLCGRGGVSNHNPANKRYRRRILVEQQRYQALNDDKAKHDFSTAFLDREKMLHLARFLKKDNKGWYEITDEAARQKIGQALREDHTVQGKEEKKARSAQRKGGAKKEQKKGKKKKDSK